MLDHFTSSLAWKLSSPFRAFRADPARVGACWLRRPLELAGREICLFVTYAPRGRVAKHALAHARAWFDQGFAVVLIVALDHLQAFEPVSDLEFCEGVLLRFNAGYDFGAWAAAVRGLPAITDAAVVALANDSVYGPLSSFAQLLARMRADSAGLIGVVESGEIQRHFQSFLLFFKAAALRNRAFKRFWRGVAVGDRAYVIEHYELQIASYFARSGVTTNALFPLDELASASNPTLTRWRDLIARGFPFIKSQLLRENPLNTDITGWQDVLRAHKFDPELVEQDLASRS